MLLVLSFQEYNMYGWWVGELNNMVGIVPKNFLMPAYDLEEWWTTEKGKENKENIAYSVMFQLLLLQAVFHALTQVPFISLKL